ncbi:MAG: Gfo/Idh/MocA family oxidoreductase [Acidobacteria bacterium]|nr:Gfo/Idh/MocA family oxidoreductase [Acidobacteriota bacterium]
MNRRQMIFTGAATAASAMRVAGANDKISVAMIGVRGQGRHLTGKFAANSEVRLAWLCDTDQRVYDNAAKVAEEKSGQRPPYVQDLRKVLDDKNVDAVVIATPDHWHAPGTILACDAGKDVYVEKPASHNLREGRLMVEAAQRNKRVVQLGTQSRSRPSTQRAMEYIQSGKIGRVLMAKAWDVQKRDFIGHKEDSTAPAEVDYDTWLGPAVQMPFNENRFHYKWHWNWNTGTGDIGNDGIHQMDMARWALGVDRPTKISGMGRKLFFDDDQQTPDTMNITYEFGPKVIQFEMRIWNPYGMETLENGVAVYGSDGMLLIGKWAGSWGYKVLDSKGAVVVDESKCETDMDDAHPRNFVACIRNRKAPNADIEIGHASSTLCHLGNIVARTGRAIVFDPVKETIAGDPEASRLLTRSYRTHWSVPKGL